jgi:ribosomal protein S12 methylthiotransferase
MMKIGIISLGCPRNLVDSEVMMGLLKERGHSVVDEIGKSDVAIVNTCAFIKDATDESLDTIFSLIDLKNKKKIRHIVVAGCLIQRYKKELKKELKEIDGFIGTGDLMNIDSIIGGIEGKNRPFIVSEKPEFVYDSECKRDLIAPRHSVYVKIQEGCGNRCSYCVIPDIRGSLRSRPIEDILKEIKSLSRGNNISEINIIGQDTTFYGQDLYKKRRTAELLRSIAELRKARWIRLLYTHPAHYTEELIEAIRGLDSVCKYIDLPIQHISDKLLKKMNRATTSASIRSLIEDLRERIPRLAIRSTVMVGFPGETDSDFKKLLRFVEETRFERLGTFIYSDEEGSRSFGFRKKVPDKVKKARLDEVMRLQQDISLDHNKSFLNEKIEVLIDEEDRKSGNYIGRTEFDAPSVDGQVFVKGRGLKAGDFVNVFINDTMEYDLVGEAA